TMVRILQVPSAESGKRRIDFGPIVFRVVFEQRPGKANCATKMTGDFFQGNEDALPNLAAALDLIGKNGFGKVEVSPKCPGDFTGNAADATQISRAYTSHGQLVLTYAGISDWTITARL